MITIVGSLCVIFLDLSSTKSKYNFVLRICEHWILINRSSIWTGLDCWASSCNPDLKVGSHRYWILIFGRAPLSVFGQGRKGNGTWEKISIFANFICMYRRRHLELQLTSLSQCFWIISWPTYQCITLRGSGLQSSILPRIETPWRLIKLQICGLGLGLLALDMCFSTTGRYKDSVEHRSHWTDEIHGRQSARWLYFFVETSTKSPRISAPPWCPPPEFQRLSFINVYRSILTACFCQ